METRRNAELLKPVAATIKRLALTSGQLLQLPSAYELGLKFGSIDFHLPSNLLRLLPRLGGAYLELLRNSTRLFKATHTLAWSRVFVAWPNPRPAITGLERLQMAGDEVRQFLRRLWGEGED